MGIGMGAVEKAVERSAARTGGSGEYLPGIYWTDKAKDAENSRKVIRFLTDDVITCKIYEFVKGGTVRDDGKQSGRDFFAPASLVDDDGKALYSELDGEKDYFLENNVWLPAYKGTMTPPAKYAKEKTLGLAVVREEVKTVDDNGKRRSKVIDKVEKRSWEDKDGVAKEEEGLMFGIVKQGHKNFWATLVGYFNRYGTITDRDYEIIRNGGDKDTTYVIMPMDVDPELETTEQLRAKYFAKEGEDKTPFKCPLELKDYIIPKARYATAEEWLKGQKQGAPAGSDAPATNGQDNAERAVAAEEASEPVRQTKSAGTQSLREELESYAKTK